MSDQALLVLRADADAGMGTGHVMRCLALAQGWRSHGRQAVFVSACSGRALRNRLLRDGFGMVPVERSYPDPADWEVTGRTIAARQPAWTVLDGYHFDAAYQRRIRQAGSRLVVIDDTARQDHYHTDVLLNQNLGAGQLCYFHEPYTTLLLGSQYALLRAEFLIWQGWRREFRPTASRILVTLGGSDPSNHTAKVIRALQGLQLDGLEATVAVGAGNPNLGSLQKAVSGLASVRLVRNATDMARLMAWADIAVTAGGTTCYELAFMGLPSVILILAENQMENASELDRRGVAMSLGWSSNVSETRLAQALQALALDRARREAMGDAGQSLVDGEGADRVLSSMIESTPSEADSQVRRATLEDARLLWGWANDTGVRANSFHPEIITWDEHIDWFRSKLASDDTRFWILEVNQLPVAQIRYDRSEKDSAVVGYSVAAGCRGRGLGTRLLVMTSKIACRELGVRQLKGVTLTSNVASAHAFAKAGYQFVSKDCMSGRECGVYVWVCPVGREGNHE